jgi:hypothetical protein
LGGEVMLAPVGVAGEPKHDPAALADALVEVFAAKASRTPSRN